MTDLGLICEFDEQWSFVGNKKQQRWLWYIWSFHAKTVVAYVFGARRDKVLKQLLQQVAHLNIAIYCTDNWEAYRRCLPPEKHLISKAYTQRIERLARKTICFSKSVELHDKVVGEFIRRIFF